MEYPAIANAIAYVHRMDVVAINRMRSSHRGVWKGWGGDGFLATVRDSGENCSWYLDQLGMTATFNHQSEDDSHGGRRKKGLKEEVKEKMPRHHHEPQVMSSTTLGGYSSAQYEGQHEKKGIMEKIKEKLSGHH
ncbi:dehydrin Rab18-like [Benincasa hispida]|uniref:dehydrin Rab18-like n=1 Tax=Benincasa hispida TaxID=102211 RepID=UPI001901167A|nr:dehydrin Rab18-like [Benincasa hispida]